MSWSKQGVRWLLIVAALVTATTHHLAHAEQTIVCGSAPGERQVCAADTEQGVTLVRSLGVAACDLGRTWGYDANGVWVADGCGAEFSVGEANKADVWFGEYTPTQGFKIADTQRGDLNIRVYTYLRYLNEKGIEPTYTDYFGNTRD